MNSAAEKQERKKKKEQERTTINKKLFLEQFEHLRGMIAPTCDAIGIHRDTYYDWIDTDKEFHKKVKNILRARPDMLLDRLFRKAMEQGDTRAIIYQLEHLHPDFQKKPKEEPRDFTDILYEMAERRKKEAEAEVENKRAYIEQRKIEEEYERLKALENT